MTVRSLTRSAVAAGAFALLSVAAAAQTTTTPPAANTPPASSMPGATAPRAATVPAPNPLMKEDVSKITGTAVYGGDDKKIGTISTVLIKPASKTVDRLVVSDGGILGVGSHLVAVPIDEFTWDSARAVFLVSITADQLKAMPEWKEQVSAAVQ